MRSEEFRVENHVEHFADLAFRFVLLPGTHALSKQLRFGREIWIGVIVHAVNEIIMHQKTAELHADVFLREWLVGEVCDYFISIFDPVRPGARGQIQFIVLASVRSAETSRNGLCGKMILLLLLWWVAS